MRIIGVTQSKVELAIGLVGDEDVVQRAGANGRLYQRWRGRVMPPRNKAAIAARLPVRRGLDECEAAIYLSISPSFFRKLVETRAMPRPGVVGARRIWDVEELDLAFKSLPREGGDAELAFVTSENRDSWADVLVPLHPELRSILAIAAITEGMILQTTFRKPFSRHWPSLRSPLIDTELTSFPPTGSVYAVPTCS